MKTKLLALLELLILMTSACAADSERPRTLEGHSHLAVSADMMNRTLSILDVDRLTQGANRSDALLAEVDLSAHGTPMSLAISPDGRTALVSISAGFLNLIAGVPSGKEALLFVDLETLSVTHELAIGQTPMGIAFTPDGTRAFVGLLGETNIVVVDVINHSFEKLATGATFNEELAVDDSGNVAVLSYGAAGDARTFSVSDPAMSGGTSGMSGDAAGVAFFPGTRTAFVLQAATPLTAGMGGYDVLDVSNPAEAVVLESVRVRVSGFSYPATAVHARNSIAYPITGDRKNWLVEVRQGDTGLTEVQRIEVGASGLIPYGVGETHDSRVLVAEPGNHYVGVVDLESGTAFTVPWEQSEYGPTEIKVIPARTP